MPPVFSKRSVFMALILFMGSGCSSGPIKPDQPVSDLSVTDVRAELLVSSTASQESRSIDSMDNNTLVIWGGTIINTQNLSDTTQIEIMGYPLDRRQRPMTARDPQGRFLIQYKGYLEPVDYAAGRSLTVLGRLQDVITGTVGEAQYQYPALQSESIHLWKPYDQSTRSGFSFGMGINLSN